MTTFLQIVILFAVAAIAILIVYLIDRVNNLQRLTRLLQPDAPSTGAPTEAEGPFGDLAGQRLWAALSGVPTEGWDQTALDLVRNRYTLVLRKHIEDLFYEGLMHGKAGTQLIPSPSRSIRTLRGTVESWIPVEHAMTIYKAGLDVATGPPETLAAVRNSLDAAVDGLFNAVSIKLARPMSETLIPVSEAERSAPQPLSGGEPASIPAAGSGSTVNPATTGGTQGALTGPQAPPAIAASVAPAPLALAASEPAPAAAASSAGERATPPPPALPQPAAAKAPTTDSVAATDRRKAG
jgi:hypothetical protein